MKSLVGYRTIAVNVLTLLVAAATLFTGNITDPETLKVALGVIAALNLVLRFLTTTPVGEKPTEPPTPGAGA